MIVTMKIKNLVSSITKLLINTNIIFYLYTRMLWEASGGTKSNYREKYSAGVPWLENIYISQQKVLLLGVFGLHITFL